MAPEPEPPEPEPQPQPQPELRLEVAESEAAAALSQREGLWQASSPSRAEEEEKALRRSILLSRTPACAAAVSCQVNGYVRPALAVVSVPRLPVASDDVILRGVSVPFCADRLPCGGRFCLCTAHIHARCICWR